MNLKELTPVEKKSDYFFKRDDLFKPFSDTSLNGGKVRQCLSVLSSNYKSIKKECNGTVCTISSVHSPQGYLVSRCAAEFGLKTIVGVGTSRPDQIEEKYPAFKMAALLGATIDPICKAGYNNVLQSRMKRISQEKGWFYVGFGINANMINSLQIQNLPDVDRLIIPCGSGYTAKAILQGLEGKTKKPKIHIIQISGMDRRKVLASTWGVPYTFIVDKTYPYHEKVKIDYNGVELDEIYEAKAFKWMQRAKYLTGTICFWDIANFNLIRNGGELK